MKITDAITHPSITLILGDQGSGKSATAYHLLDHAEQSGVSAHVVGMPEAKWPLLPGHIVPLASLEAAMDTTDSALLVDESYMLLHARDPGKAANKLMSKLLGVHRQRGQSWIFVAQGSWKLDINMVREADAIIVKHPSQYQADFERPQLRAVVEKARSLIDPAWLSDEAEGKKWAYVHSPRYIGALTVPLPPYWTEGLSKAWAGAKAHEPKPVAAATTATGMGDPLMSRSVAKLLIDIEHQWGPYYLAGDGWTYDDVAERSARVGHTFDVHDALDSLRRRGLFRQVRRGKYRVTNPELLGGL